MNSKTLRSILFPLLTSLSICLITSCGGPADQAPLIGTTTSNVPAATALFEKAQTAAQAGKTKSADKLYKKLHTKYPLSAEAGEALYRRGIIQQDGGDLIGSFDTFQRFIEKNPTSEFYNDALARQARVAHAAAQGVIKNSFLGLKSRIAPEKSAKMLTSVIANAPKAPSAPLAQNEIGKMWESRRSPAKAIAAYRKMVNSYPSHKLAPEAQYRVAKILIEQAKNGNQDQANLLAAREEFKDFLSVYPNAARASEVRSQLKKLENQDVDNSFKIAEFYEKKGQTESAKFYYREVLKKSPSGALADQAKARLAVLGE